MRAEVDLVELSSHRVIRARHAPAPTRITSEDSAPDSPDEKDSTSLTSPEPAAQEPGSAQYGGWTGAAWCWWGSCGDPGRERVQICHKGAPRRYRPRRKARNINDSSRTLRLDPGLCGRFGQPAAADRPGRAVTGRATAGTGLWEGRPRPGDDHNGHPGERTGPTDHGDGLPGRSLTPKRALRTRKCSSNRHSRVQNVPLDEEGAGRSHRGPRRRPRGPRRPRPPGRRFRREGLNASSARTM